MSTGYVKIFRSIEENVLWQDAEPFGKRAAWIDLILMANHKDSSFLMGVSKINIKRGQKWTSLGHLADRWHWSRERVSRYLNLLENEGMIWQERTNRGLLITIVNYSVYQDFSPTTKQPTSQPTSQQTRISQDIKQDIKQVSQRVTNNNVKNDIKNDIKNEYKNVNKRSAHSDFFVEE